MDPVGLLLMLVVVGVILAAIPIDATIRNLIIAIVVIAVVVWLLGATGTWNYGHGNYRFR